MTDATTSGGAALPALLSDRTAQGRLGLAEAMAVMDALCETVGEGHRAGVVVGSLRPEIVWWDGSRAKVVEGSAPAGATYLSPQQLEGKPGDARADVFALGVIAYRTLTGVDPFGDPAADPAARLAAIEAGATDPLTHLPKLNDRVRRTLLIALARNLTERFADALTMRAALRGDSVVALDTPTLKWAVAEGIPEGDTGAADEYAESEGLLGGTGAVDGETGDAEPEDVEPGTGG